MLFAKRIYTWAGFYGLGVVGALYLAEGLLAQLYGPMSLPLAYYGLMGAILSFQLVYLLIGRDPVRFRPVMPLAILAKVMFGGTAVVLFAIGRTPLLLMAMSLTDLAWAVGFALAWRATPKVDYGG